MFQMLHVIPSRLSPSLYAGAARQSEASKSGACDCTTDLLPGFTIVGIGEFAVFIVVALLFWSTPRGTVAFRLALGALLGVLAMQAVYLIAIHPSNKFWPQGRTLSAADPRFFSFDPTSHKQD